MDITLFQSIEFDRIDSKLHKILSHLLIPHRLLLQRQSSKTLLQDVGLGPHLGSNIDSNRPR